MAAEIAESMSRRWRMLFHRPVLADVSGARVDARVKLAFEAKEPALDETGTQKALGAEMVSREGRITAVNARREAAKRSRDWSASS
jgi:hypothetical protein